MANERFGLNADFILAETVLCCLLFYNLCVFQLLFMVFRFDFFIIIDNFVIDNIWYDIYQIENRRKAIQMPVHG